MTTKRTKSTQNGHDLNKTKRKINTRTRTHQGTFNLPEANLNLGKTTHTKPELIPQFCCCYLLQELPIKVSGRVEKQFCNVNEQR